MTTKERRLLVILGNLASNRIPPENINEYKRRAMVLIDEVENEDGLEDSLQDLRITGTQDIVYEQNPKE